MQEFLIAAASSAAPLISAIEALGGKQISTTSWIAYWDDTADALCRQLRPTCPGGIIVCALSGDWSYR